MIGKRQHDVPSVLMATRQTRLATRVPRRVISVLPESTTMMPMQPLRARSARRARRQRAANVPTAIPRIPSATPARLHALRAFLETLTGIEMLRPRAKFARQDGGPTRLKRAAPLRARRVRSASLIMICSRARRAPRVPMVTRQIRCPTLAPCHATSALRADLTAMGTPRPRARHALRGP